MVIVQNVYNLQLNIYRKNVQLQKACKLKKQVLYVTT